MQTSFEAYNHLCSFEKMLSVNVCQIKLHSKTQQDTLIGRNEKKGIIVWAPWKRGGSQQGQQINLQNKII